MRTNADRLRAARSSLRLATLGLTTALALSVAAPVFTVTHLGLRHDRIPVVLITLDAQLVVDIPDAGYGVEDALG